MYGLMILVGIICCFVVLHLFSKRMGVNKQAVSFYEILALLSIVVGFLSAALFQGVYNVIDGRDFFDGGITFLGGLIGGAATFILISLYGSNKTIKAELPKILLIAPMCISIAHAFGRVGCYFAGCCYGLPSEKYGVVFTAHAEPISVLPTNMYEAIFLFILFGALLTLTLLKKENFNMIVYLISYGIFRFVLEFFRADERGQLLFFITPSQTWSLLMVVLGVALIVYPYIKARKSGGKPPEKPEESGKIAE